MFWLAPLALAQDEVAYDHVIIVLDASGSMGARFGNPPQEKMEAAKLAIKTVVGTLPPTTRVGVLVFSASGVSDEWVYPLAPLDKDRLYGAIDPIRPNSGTPLGEYLKTGADRLLRAREEQHGYGSYRLLVVTDGEAQDQNLVELYAPDIVQRGVVLDTIGVDMKSAHTLKAMSHSYRSADDPASLTKAVEEVFAEVAISPGQKIVGADAFQVTADVPEEFARALLSTLGTTGNHPIGAPQSAPPPKQGDPRNVGLPDDHPQNTQSCAVLTIVPVGIAGWLVVMGATARRMRE